MGYVAAFIFGLFLWTLIEYAVHGWLGHQSNTPVAQVHRVHHLDEHRVFAVRAWLPLVVYSIASWFILGPGTAMVTWCGVLAGFIIYEAIHFRIHFRQPKSAFETYLKAHHLLHHRHPDAYFGVTTPVWDLVFGSERLATAEEWAATAAVAPIGGRTNLRRLFVVALNPFTMSSN